MSINNTREYWLETMLKIATPVIENLANRTLKEKKPLEVIERYSTNPYVIGRKYVDMLQIAGRTIAGIAPWLEAKNLSQEEEVLREKFCELTRKAIDSATDPESPDYVKYEEGIDTGIACQAVVDAAFFAHGLLRAPNELWEKLDDKVKKNVVNLLKHTRLILPGYNNWLLFSAIIEAFLCKAGEEDWDRMRIDYAIREHMRWYKGDGFYGDGPDVHMDYYNSYVIQPMLVDIINTVESFYKHWGMIKENIMKNAKRYAAILERMISPEGSFPTIGRSITYRMGAMQHLSQMALQHNIPEGIYPSQIRCALTSVIKRIIDAPRTFDANGWLRIGFYGEQQTLGEGYISTGSLYLCSTAFLPLGLSPDDEFWSDVDRPWTSQKLWSGEQVKADKAI